MFHDVAMKYEAPDDFRISERNDELCLARFSIARGRNTKRVAKPIEIGWSTIDFRNQKSCLMNVKVVILRIFVEDRPFFGVAQFHCYVRPVLIKDLVVYEKRCLLWVDRKCERAPLCNRTRSHHAP